MNVPWRFLPRSFIAVHLPDSLQAHAAHSGYGLGRSPPPDMKVCNCRICLWFPAVSLLYKPRKPIQKNESSGDQRKGSCERVVSNQRKAKDHQNEARKQFSQLLHGHPPSGAASTAIARSAPYYWWSVWLPCSQTIEKRRPETPLHVIGSHNAYRAQ